VSFRIVSYSLLFSSLSFFLLFLVRTKPAGVEPTLFAVPGIVPCATVARVTFATAALAVPFFAPPTPIPVHVLANAYFAPGSGAR
jgi:hypothetical protein